MNRKESRFSVDHFLPGRACSIRTLSLIEARASAIICPSELEVCIDDARSLVDDLGEPGLYKVDVPVTPLDD